MKNLKMIAFMLAIISCSLLSCKKKELLSDPISSKELSEQTSKTITTTPLAILPQVWGPPPSNGIALTRLYNPYQGVHMLANPEETYVLLAQKVKRGSNWFPAWVNEGILGYGLRSGGKPLYRFYAIDDHYFSTNSSIPAGYVLEGIQTYVYTSATSGYRPIYAFSTISGKTDHVYTANPNELNGNSAWRNEGIAFYLMY
ncbi:hypothetical protein [Pedobacter rhizosphaerae]|uniref:DUF5648 domain-containing protein n=1 Tax=Pedobacter rhizosphaerae TaxID=390241 RepID=A0A1H9V3K7_9SPHI|nr:hypothetical protein [Pedobacter rhizosphaerae]SES16400.1 hypothetical protein SAMN04488023_13732 [Pedobacter rhizosphaerae]